jgi:SAM-dependent methyltransferase
VFGEVADLYDRHRPAYPERLIEDVIALAGLDRETVLEVGAGTGKATRMFAARGIPVVAVEPSAAMAALAARNCEGLPVAIERSDFELWESRGRRFPLLFSAQAWHWVKPELRYPKARDVLLERGVLAVFWNRAAWERCDARQELLAAYEHVAPQLSHESVMHPAYISPEADEDWESEVGSAAGFGGADIRGYAQDALYTADEFVGLLATISEIRLLDEPTRAALFATVTEVIEARGRPLALPLQTRLCLARRT